jgi:hypothetical protein
LCIIPGNSPVDPSDLLGFAALDSAFELGTETAEKVDGNSFVHLHSAANHELIFGCLEFDGYVFFFFFWDAAVQFKTTVD